MAASEARRLANGAAAKSSDIIEDAQARASGTIAAIDQVVARNPAGALIAALGVGLVLGMMARR